MKQVGGGLQPAVADPLPRHDFHGVSGLVAPRWREGDAIGQLLSEGCRVGERLGAESLDSDTGIFPISTLEPC